MTLEELQQMWKEDCGIDQTRIGDEVTRTPQLHCKYTTLFSNIRLRLRKASTDYTRLRRLKYRYYRGEMSRDELKERGWDQWQGVKPLKNEMEELLDTDEDLLLLQDRMEYLKVCGDFVEQAVRHINARTFEIKNLNEWNRFTSGG